MDQVIGSILRYLYFNQKTGPSQSLTFVFSKCNADILVVGNSRAKYHYNTKILSDSLKMSCYNAGQDGGHSILLQYAQITELTNRHTPKIIILEFHPSGILYNKIYYDLISTLTPYYKEYPVIRPIIEMQSPYERIKLASAIYPFNSNVINSIRFNTNTHAARKEDFNGYVPLKGIINRVIPKPASLTITQPKLDTNMLNALRNIILLCNEKNINLFIISSPVFHEIYSLPPRPSSIEKLALAIIQSNKIKFLDFTYDSAFTGHFDWFKDKGHLNGKGADVYTNRLIAKLKLGLILEK